MQDLARLAAPVFYAARRARRSRLPISGGCAQQRCIKVSCPCEPRPVRVGRRTRPRDARRVEAHRATLSAKGLRLKAAPYVPDAEVFVGLGDGWVPAKKGRRGRKAVRVMHRGRRVRAHALPPVPRRGPEPQDIGGGVLFVFLGVVATSTDPQEPLRIVKVHPLHHGRAACGAARAFWRSFTLSAVGLAAAPDAALIEISDDLGPPRGCARLD